MPVSNLTSKVLAGDVLDKKDKEKRKEESQNDIYVYAGYVEPGKHQIIIKDQITGKYYTREIVLETRSRDIINCAQIDTDKKKSSQAIHRFT